MVNQLSISSPEFAHDFWVLLDPSSTVEVLMAYRVMYLVSVLVGALYRETNILQCVYMTQKSLLCWIFLIITFIKLERNIDMSLKDLWGKGLKDYLLSGIYTLESSFHIRDYGI